MTGMLFRVCVCAMAALGMLSNSALAQNDPEKPLWLRYPAISPDGAQIAFAYQGQIWISPTQGGEAVPLTSGPYRSTHPVWSPDGAQIAFASDRHGNPDIFVMPASGGKVTRLTHYGSAAAPRLAADLPMAFSTDGSRIFFHSPRLGDPVADAIDSHKGLGAPVIPQLYSVAADGGRPRMEMATPAHEIAIERNGNRMLYTSQNSIENEWRKHHISDAARDIWLYTPDTAEYRKLTEWRGEDRDAHFSPDAGSCKIIVSSLAVGGRADEAGLSLGDVITEVDGQNVENISLDDFCMLRGTVPDSITTDAGKTYDIGMIEGFFGR